MCKKVLIVDDDSAFVYQLINEFMQPELSFSLAESLDGAKKMIEKTNYDIVLANTRIPGGRSVLLKNVFYGKMKNQKMIFMSGVEQEVARCASAGEICLTKSDINKCGVNIFE